MSARLLKRIVCFHSDVDFGMTTHLDRRRREHGQVRLVGEDLAVRHHPHARVVEVEPLGHLVVRHDVHVADPRRVLLEAAEREQELGVGSRGSQKNGGRVDSAEH